MSSTSQTPELVRKQLLKDAADVFGSPAGKRILWHLLAYCRFLESTYTGNSLTFFQEGQRSVGLHLLDMVGQASPALLAETLTMGLKERSEHHVG